MNPYPEPQAMTGWTPAWKAAGWSHPGRVRGHNEDRFHCDAARGLFMVIDGVGGQRAGEVAASTALKAMLDRLRRKTGTPEERLREAITLANNEIYEAARQQAAQRGMACVLTVALLDGSELTVGHVGDTRLYKICGGRIQKLTHDHSPVGVREDAGELSEQEAMRHPRRNEIYRDVGSALHDPHDPDFIQIIHDRFAPDCALVLCSDGLTDLVPSAEILHVVQHRAGRPEQVVQELIDRANEAGGKDNISVVVVEGAQFAAAAAAASPGAGAAIPPVSGPSDRAGPSPRGSLFTSRWALFVYGVLVGLLLLLVLQRLLLEQRRPLRPAAASTLRVAPDSTAPYQTIAAALQAAQAGDVIEVGPGVYAGAVRIKEGVQLVSGEPRAALILPAETDTVAVVALDGSRLAGFRVLNAAGPGVVVQGTTVLVEDVEVAGMAGPGVVIDSLAGGTLRASHIHDNEGGGIVIRGGAAPRLVHNLILDNGTGTARPGVWIAPTADPVLEGNVITGNGGGAVVVTPPSRTRALAQRNFFEATSAEGE